MPHQQLTATPDEIRALMEILQRIPVTRAEGLFMESLFARWADQMQMPPSAPEDTTPAPAPEA